ncbi:PAS domain-containing hybrid sensor histidine kinase/response regulator [Blastochloris viridis]|uniref:histidine kinase n=1 Tax=Blastochloris viridis TaxID=1079 RepID=A0A0H5BD90_BLAVI|nr:PAS domain-containing hybrid sensor histidine kinase/response regulator [Blastochloris viridis]ALK08426.1 Non-motile and phage-resistance protein [Blastochloris viridis]BAR98296.1 na+/proline symporter [Blastochloris viridis]CUU41088.1 Non-motile and phage-resistance protein [Blastochloris viridis]
MLQGWVVVALAVGYIGLLFLIASFGDRLKARDVERRSRRFIYPLSLAVYCTSWTFFGSVGLSSHAGFDFLAIYIGPIIMIGFAWPLLIRILRLAKAQNITSIADFIAARYGKNQTVAALVTVVAVIAVVPYIALQLKAVSSSLATILSYLGVHMPASAGWFGDLALFVAILMALFATLFGTRHTDATEHQEGLMLAIATESVVKLIAFLAVGIFVVFVMFDGPSDLFGRAAQHPELIAPLRAESFGGPWVTMTLLSFFAILLLPRQFHVAVVENNGEDEVRRAAWLFPLYLVLINLFVVPVAIAGLISFPPNTLDSDMFVLGLPLSVGSDLMALVAFIGGLSAATAMVIVESVAISIMVSNGLVMPLMLRRRLNAENAAGHGHGAAVAMGDAGDMARVVLATRRIAILVTLALAYFYYRTAGTAQLAQIGLLAFAAVAQFAPAFFGGLFWRGANARGAIAGLVVGTLVWGYTLLLPTFVAAGLVDPSILNDGPFGLFFLKPQGLFGLNIDPLTHGVLWSLGANIACFVCSSLTRSALPIEQLQANVFVDAEAVAMSHSFRLWRTSLTIGELIATVARYLGEERARRSFESFAETRRISLDPHREADIHLLRYAEFLLSSAIGAASSRLVLSLLLRKRTVSTKAALKLLDDASAAFHYNREVLQTALDHVRQGIAVFDKDMRLICWNRRFGEMLDIPRDVMRLGVRFDELVRFEAIASGLTPAEVEAIVADRIERYTVKLETVQERMPGAGIVIEARAARMPDGGVVMTFTDITESVNAAEALERANETLERRVHERTEELTRLNVELKRAKAVAEEANISKTRFLAAASHDVLQPLNAARLYTSALVERTAGEGEEGRLVRNVDASLDAVEEILGAVLEISRLDTGALKAEMGVFRLSDLFEQLKTDFAPLAAEKGLRLTFVPTSIVVRSDRRLLRRLVQNLVSNAIKYTPRGRVLVGVRREWGRARIEVHDTGLGIPSQQQKLIFKEFQRLEQGARVARGLGLGLSIVERLARVLQHRIRLDSTPGEGSTFAVELPRVSALPDLALPAPPLPPVHAPLAGMSVLAVDNEPAILDGMVALLSNWGCKVATALSLDDARAALRDMTPDVLLVDYHLDEGNGLDAVMVLRWRLGSETPAVLITADRSPALREAAREKTVQLLNKPVNPAALRALLARWRLAQRMAG